MRQRTVVILFAAALFGKEPKPPTLTPLDEYVKAAEQRVEEAEPRRAGSLWSPGAMLGDLPSDLRARRVDDIVTVIIVDRASAIARGTTKSARSASASASVSALGGTFDPTGRLANLANLGGQSQLDGQGETSRETVLQTTLAARVVKVLPNGFLVVEGDKSVAINSEAQTVRVRGIVRPVDVTPGNSVLSDRLGQLEVSVNGKGVVGDAIRRPNFLYRLLLGVLPF